MGFLEDNEDRPKVVNSTQEQIGEDGEIFEAAKIDEKKIAKISDKAIVQGVIKMSEVLSGLSFYPYQREAAERIVYCLITDDGETLTIEFARQGGKSTIVSGLEVGCGIMLPLLAQYLEPHAPKHPIMKFKSGIWIGNFAPDYERAGIIGKKTNSFLSSPTSKLILSDGDIGMTFPEKVSKFNGRLPRNSYINIKSANKKVSIEGDTYHWVTTDETQEVSDYVLKKSISPMLAATNGLKVHIGSPYPKRVYFYDVIRKNKSRDLDAPKTKKTHFEADYHVVQKYNKNYKKYIESEKLLLGEMSDEFRMSYELYWVVDKGMFVSDDLLLNKLGKAYNMTTYDKTRDHVIGIDVGKIQDPTVITVLAPDWDNPILVDADSGTTRYVKPIKNWLEIADDDYDMQFHLICDFLGNYKWRTLVIDATGVGQHMYDRLNNKYSKENKQVIPFVYSRPNKSHLFTLLARELISERVTFPNNTAAQKSRKQKKFVSQMLDMAKSIEGGYLNIVTTTDKGHDDYPNSLALAVYGVESDEIQTSVEEVTELEGIYSSNNSGKNFWH